MNLTRVDPGFVFESKKERSSHFVGGTKTLKSDTPLLPTPTPPPQKKNTRQCLKKLIFLYMTYRPIAINIRMVVVGDDVSDMSEGLVCLPVI